MQPWQSSMHMCIKQIRRVSLRGDRMRDTAVAEKGAGQEQVGPRREGLHLPTLTLEPAKRRPCTSFSSAMPGRQPRDRRGRLHSFISWRADEADLSDGQLALQRAIALSRVSEEPAILRASLPGQSRARASVFGRAFRIRDRRRAASLFRRGRGLRLRLERDRRPAAPVVQGRDLRDPAWPASAS